MSSDSLFKALVNHSLTGILIITKERIRFANRTFRQMTGYGQDDIDAMSPWDMVHPEERDAVRALGTARLRKKKVKAYYETRWVKKDGSPLWVEVRVTVIPGDGEPEILANVIDISERKTAEAELKRREEALQHQSRELEETNTALRVLLRQQGRHKRELQHNTLFNVERLIMPHLDKLERHIVDTRLKSYLTVIRSNLYDMIAPQFRKLAGGSAGLTDREIRIANMIKQGKSSKEMAAMLFVGKATIDFHRHNIRKKLGLLHRKINLRTYLSQAEPDEWDDQDRL